MYDVKWSPVKKSSQYLALLCRANEILLAGSRGSMKTETQLMYFRQFVGKGYGNKLRGIALSLEYSGTRDMIARSQTLFSGMQDGAKFTGGNAGAKWEWETGEVLIFDQCKNKKEYQSKLHGQEYPIILINELTTYPFEELYDLIRTTNRSSFIPNENQQHIPLVTLSTTNPMGIGHNWVKQRFIDGTRYGQTRRFTDIIENPLTKEKVETFRSRVAIFSSMFENPYLPSNYIAEMSNISDPELKKAYFLGSWDVTSGGALSDVWKKHIHVIPRFRVPKSWIVDRSLDWGTARPFAVCWWAEADGTEAYFEDGTVFCPPRGTLIKIAEYYGSDKIGTNKGIGLSAREVAIEIKQREKELIDTGYVQGRIYSGAADGAIFNPNQAVEQDSIADIMSDEGVNWETADKSPGSRIIGLELMRTRLKNAITGEDPALYFCENCVASTSLLPHLKRDDKKFEDIDTEQEDHDYDAVRYRVLQSNRKMHYNINKSVHFG